MEGWSEEKPAVDMEVEVATESETIAVVYLLLPRFIYGIDLCSTWDPKLSKRIIHSGRVEQKIDFLQKGFPIGTNSFIIDDHLHLVGGEIVKIHEEITKISPDSDGAKRFGVVDLVIDTSGPGKGFNTTVHILKPHSFDLIGAHFPPLPVGKTRPQVATIENKIYVLGSVPARFHRGCDLPKPAFECFDIAKNSWYPLPEPPRYRELHFRERWKACHILGHYVIGQKIFVKNGYGYFCYDVNSQKWESAESFIRDHLDVSAPSPFGLGGSFGEGENGIVIAFTRVGLVAYQYDSAGNLLRHQILDELNSQFPPSQRCYGFIRHLGGGNFCYVLSGGDETSVWAVYIQVFEIRVQSGVNRFLTVIPCGPCQKYDFQAMIDNNDLIIDRMEILNFFVVPKRTKQ